MGKGPNGTNSIQIFVFLSDMNASSFFVVLWKVVGSFALHLLHGPVPLIDLFTFDRRILLNLIYR